MSAPNNTSLDLNADLGEGVEGEDALMALITSANIACGGHAGDPESMRDSLLLARARGVSPGAHPSLADRAGFGRRELPTTPQEAYALVREQTETLRAAARPLGLRLAHVKPHGALYNLAARDDALAHAVARAVKDAGVRVLYGLAGSSLVRAAREVGLRAVGEAFADRGYTRAGRLVPRGEAGALLVHPEAVRQALRVASRGELVAVTGERVAVEAGTLCLHGDGPGAVELARALRNALEGAGVSLRSPLG